MLISSKLWLSERDFPHFPVWDFIPLSASPFDQIFLIAFVLALLLLVVLANRNLAVVALVLILIFALQDQMRWQPWFYQYALMLLPFAFVDHLKSEEDGEAVIGIQQTIIIMIYVWGGINKCHSGFLSVYNNSLMAPVYEMVGKGAIGSLLGGFGYLIPPIEILTGIGLFFRKTRLWGIIAATLTHLTILLLLGPIKGYISNPVVWPWNVVMLAMVFCLFFKTDTKPSFAFLKTRLALPGIIVSALIFLAPILFYAGKWDRYLSFHLYSGYQKRILVKIEASSLPLFPENLSPYLLDTKASDGHKLLSPSIWATEELKVPLISEWRILRSLSRKLCQHDLGSQELIFYVDYRHFPHKPKGYFRCDEIEKMGD